MTNVVEQIQSILRSSEQKVYAKSSYFKTGPGGYAEHDQFLGVPNPSVRKLAQQYQTIPLTALKELLTSVYNEERLLALFILVFRYAKALEEEQKELYLFYLAHTSFINNWNLVDASAHLIVGDYLYTKEKEILITLAESTSVWERRIALVATWYFIRKGSYEWTFRIATLLLNDPHDLIHKAGGWMLREVGKRDKQELHLFLQKKAPYMPRTMLRYALEHCSFEEKRTYKELKKTPS